MRRLLNIIFVAACACLGSVSGAVAAVPGCANPAQSSLNQYCDSIPSAAGARPPEPGTPALASTLPPRVLNRLGANGSRRVVHQRLLSLPAPVRVRLRQGSDASGGSTWSLSLWMIVVLVAIALALVAMSAARRRQQRPRAA